MMVPLLLGDTRAPSRGDAFHYSHFTAETTRRWSNWRYLFAAAGSGWGWARNPVSGLHVSGGFPPHHEPPAAPAWGSSTSERLPQRGML